MENSKVFSKNAALKVGIVLTIIDGILAGFSYCAIYFVLKWVRYDELNFDNICRLTVGLMILFLIRFVIYGIGYTQSQLGGAKVSKNIRKELGDKFRRIPLKNFQEGHIGDYINTMNSDVANYEKILTHNIGSIAKNATLCITIIAAMALLYYPAAFVMLFVCLLLIPNIWLSFRVVRVYGKEKNDVAAQTVSEIIEYISGIQTLRIYGMCGEKNKAVNDAIYRYSDVCYKYEEKGIPIGFSYNMISWLSVPIVIFMALLAYKNGQLNTIDFIMISMLPILLIKLTTAISINLFSYKNLLISKKNIIKIMEEEEESNIDRNFESDCYDITFENVSFAYEPGHDVIKNASFYIPEHSLTAIVGESGSGKSTILNLISRYYAADSGTIRIGKNDIRDYSAEAVLDKISMVDQNVILFNDSIKDNIRYAKMDAADEEIVHVCQMAKCDSFIQKQKDRYDTQIGENGNKLSGGERQRLSIARAMIQNRPVLLLDEATASLDIENEYAVKNAIARLLHENKTMVMVAHTLSVIKNADQIIVMSDGKVIESGTHDKLMSQGGKYRQMWDAEQKAASHN